MKKYGQQILNGASISGRNVAGGGPRRPAARASHENAALACLRSSQELGMMKSGSGLGTRIVAMNMNSPAIEMLPVTQLRPYSDGARYLSRGT
jgi:hypothetical protein